MDTGDGGWTVSNTDRQTDRQTDRRTDRQTDGQTESGHTVSDVYTIQVGGSKLNVWCDMDTGKAGGR